MMTLSFLNVAAAAALSAAGAAAQPPGVSWRHAPGAAPPPVVHVQTHGAGPMSHSGPIPHAMPQAPGPVRMHDGGPGMMSRHAGPGMHHPKAGRFFQYRRLGRGVVLPHRWWGPEFQIWNWHMYGLPQPIPGGRWVRYHDDALLIDGDGRVHDGRWDMRWDDYEDERGYDDGRGHNGDDWADGPDGYDEGCRCLPPMPPAYYQPGFMWVSPGMITVTETTTTPTMVYETAYAKDKARPYRRAKPKYRAKPRPAPPGPGERG